MHLEDPKPIKLVDKRSYREVIFKKDEHGLLTIYERDHQK